LLAYNQEEYIRDAVEAALAQSYSPLQIILSDDCSDDKTFEIIKEITKGYIGHHKIILNRNNLNQGIGAHVNKVMEMALGEFIVVAAGDDISDSNRVDVILDAFLNSDEPIYSIWSAARYIDAAGTQMSRKFPAHNAQVTDKTLVRNRTTLVGATHAWRRQAFDFFGPLMVGVCFEDNAIAFRSHLLGTVKYLDRQLVSYRTHDKSLSNFTQMESSRILYAAAAKRCVWMLTAIAQRKKDMEFAIKNLPIFPRNYSFLSHELLKMEVIFKRRLKSYEQFPSLSFSTYVAAFKDIEIAKVLVRSALYKYKNSGRSYETK
jgi:glycosyltransferase involved in cell wall biosynthesis